MQPWVYFVLTAIKCELTEHQAIVILVLIDRFCDKASQKGYQIQINSLTIHR